MKADQHQIKKATEEIGAGMSDKNAQTQSLMSKVVQKATRPQDLIGLSDAMVEGIYGQAYRLYNTGKYKEATQLFRLLIMLNTSEPKYIMGLAACFHMLKEYKAAADTYAIVAVIDAKSPIPFYHVSDCFVQLKDPASAIIALEMAVKRAGDHPAYKVLKDRALMSIETLKKEMNEDLAAQQALKAEQPKDNPP